MAEHDLDSSAASADSEASIQTGHLRYNNCGAPPSHLAEGAHEETPAPQVAATATGRLQPFGPEGEEREQPPPSPDGMQQHLRRDAGSTKRMLQAAKSAPPDPAQGAYQAMMPPLDATPAPSSAQEEVSITKSAPLLDGVVSPGRRQTSEFGIAASVFQGMPATTTVVVDNKAAVTRVAEQHQQRPAGLSVAPGDIGSGGGSSSSSSSSSKVLEAAEVSRPAGQAAVASPSQGTPAAKGRTFPKAAKLVLSKLELFRRDAGSTRSMQAAAVAHRQPAVKAPLAAPPQLPASSWLAPAAEGPDEEEREEDGGFPWDQSGLGEGAGDGEEEGFEYGGEQDEQIEARDKPADSSQSKEGTESSTESTEEQEAREDDGAKETQERAEETQERAEEIQERAEATRECAEAGVKEAGVVFEGGIAHLAPGDDHCPRPSAEDGLSNCSAPAGAAAAAARISAAAASQPKVTAAVSRPHECSGTVVAGERQENTPAAVTGLTPSDSETRVTSTTEVLRGVAKPPSIVSTSLAATTVAAKLKSTEIGVLAAPGYQRRLSYMPGQAVRPARSPSIQLALPPIVLEGEQAPAPDASSSGAVENAGAEGEGSQQPAVGQSWAEFYAQNQGRQHSTSNLVAMRRVRDRRSLSVELFEGDSDETTSSSSSEADASGQAEERKEDEVVVEDPVSYLVSQEGMSRMAQLTRATVAVETPANKISKKYLKLFAPSNSVRLRVGFVLLPPERSDCSSSYRVGVAWDAHVTHRQSADNPQAGTHSTSLFYPIIVCE